MARPPSLPTNPEERQAARRRQVLPHISEVRSILRHPSHGGSRGYAEEFREQELRRFENREQITVSTATIYRWRAIPGKDIQRWHIKLAHPKIEQYARYFFLLHSPLGLVTSPDED